MESETVRQPTRSQIRILIRGFDNQKLKKTKTAKKFFFLFLIQNGKLLVQATEEAFSPQKRTSSTSKNKNFINFFLCLWVIFALLDPDRVQGPPDPDLDFQHC
jgi:hypothetical protein